MYYGSKMKQNVFVFIFPLWDIKEKIKKLKRKTHKKVCFQKWKLPGYEKLYVFLKILLNAHRILHTSHPHRHIPYNLIFKDKFCFLNYLHLFHLFLLSHSKNKNKNYKTSYHFWKIRNLFFVSYTKPLFPVAWKLKRTKKQYFGETKLNPEKLGLILATLSCISTA